jgi:hypothetical protein
MKKIVIVCGLIAGGIEATMIAVSNAACYKTGNFSGSEVVGYATMLLAFSMIFVGVKNYRDKQQQGVISFGKAFRIGLFITLIASTLYVVTWLICFYNFFPDFIDRYATHVLSESKAKGASAAALSQQMAQMETFKKMYQTPLGVAALTYVEILPVGLIVAIISALILKKKKNEPQAFTTAPAN